MDARSTIERMKLFLFDMDGTLYLGSRLFDFTIELLAEIRRTGLQEAQLVQHRGDESPVHPAGIALMLRPEGKQRHHAFILHRIKLGLQAKRVVHAAHDAHAAVSLFTHYFHTIRSVTQDSSQPEWLRQAPSAQGLFPSILRI